MHALDAADGALGIIFFGETADLAGKGHDTVFDGNADMGSIDAGFKIQFIQNILMQLIVFHD